MVPHLPPALRLLDAVGAAGLGLCWGLVFTCLRFLAGRGRVRLFFCDLACFSLASLSVCSYALSMSHTGQPRWYMAAAALGGMWAWRVLVCPAQQRLLKLLAGAAALPGRLFARFLLRPAAVLARRAVCRVQTAKKNRAAGRKNSVKTLHSKRKVLYNSK